MPLSSSTVLSAAAALAIVLALILLAARAAQRLGLGHPSPPRKRVQGRLLAQGSLPLDRSRTIHVIRCDGRDFAVLTGGPTDLLIGWLPEAAPSANTRGEAGE